MVLIKSILAGIMIGIGCNVYLSCENKYIGAFLFSIGLITILLFEFNLYTGKVCYIPKNGLKFTKQVAIILVGNIIGCVCLSLMFPSEIAKEICQNKLQIGSMNVFFKALLCNVLIYIAVESYRTKHMLLPTIFCIPTFILSGYEHSVADIAYFIMAREFSISAIIFIVIVTIGNAVGGMIIPCCDILCNKINTTK